MDVELFHSDRFTRIIYFSFSHILYLFSELSTVATIQFFDTTGHRDTFAYHRQRYISSTMILKSIICIYGHDTKKYRWFRHVPFRMIQKYRWFRYVPFRMIQKYHAFDTCRFGRYINRLDTKSIDLVDTYLFA